jgi:hypothetical protein
MVARDESRARWICLRRRAKALNLCLGRLSPRLGAELAVLAFLLATTACALIKPTENRSLAFLCPEGRLVRASFPHEGAWILLESGRDRLALPLVPASASGIYTDGRATVFLQPDGVVLAMTSGKPRAVACLAEARARAAVSGS